MNNESELPLSGRAGPKDPLYTGIDGGGTKTRAIVIDSEGRVLYETMGAASNVAVLGVSATLGSLTDILEDVRQHCPGYAENSAAAVFGLAGIGEGNGEVSDCLLSKLQSLSITRNVRLVNDGYIASYGTDRGRAAIALICGTGSSGYGIDSRGKCIVKGGMGHLLSDDGSGYQMGLAGVRRAVRAYNGMDANTALIDAALDFFSLSNFDEAPYRIRDCQEIAAFARRVYEVSEKGDRAGMEIIERAAEDLAKMVRSVWRAGDFRDMPAKVGTFGGCLTHMAGLRRALSDQLQEFSQELQLCEPVWSPERAAAELAKKCETVNGRGASTRGHDPES